MSRGKSSGGGQSSIAYLFGNSKLESQQGKEVLLPRAPASMPPYGVDTMAEPPPTPEKPQASPPPTTKEDPSTPYYTYHKLDGHNSEKLLIGRRSTKVNSVPGGDSSLGYLFGDK